MIDKLEKIDIKGKVYPFAFNLNVMETIQDKYGTLNNWADALSPKDENIEPKFKDIIWSFTQFINEGIDIVNDENKEHNEPLTHKQVGRLISGMDLGELGKMLKSTATKSINTNDPN